MNTVNKEKSEKIDLSEIRRLIDKKDWDKALCYCKNELSVCVMDKNFSDLIVKDVFEIYISALIDLQQNKIKPTIEKLNRALDLFPINNFEVEKFNANFHLANIYSDANNPKKALNYFYNAWEIAQKFENSQAKLQLLDKFILFLIKTDERQNLIRFLKEKLILLDKKIDEIEYAKTVMLLIAYLLEINNINDALIWLKKIKYFRYLPVEQIAAQINERIKDMIELLTEKNEFESAIAFIETNNLQMYPYVNLFEPLFDLFAQKPSLALLKSVQKLFKFQLDQHSSLFNSWTKKCFPLIIPLLTDNPWLLVESNQFRPIGEIILNNEDFNELFVYNLSKLTEYLFNDLNNMDIMIFLMYLNNKLSEIGNNRLYELVQSWISITLKLKEKIASNKDISITTIDENLVYNIFSQSGGTYAPLSLLKKIFEQNYVDSNFQTNTGTCNELADFLFAVNEIFYDLPEIPIRQILLDSVNTYTRTIASGYEYILLQRMKHKKSETVISSLRSNPSRVVDDLIADFSKKNPLPTTICIENAISYLIKLLQEHPNRTQDSRGNKTIKVFVWYLNFQGTFPKILQDVCNRDFKNKIYQHKILVELLRISINYFYNFWQTMRAESVIPAQNISDFRLKIVKFLKYWNNEIKLTDEELFLIIRSNPSEYAPDQHLSTDIGLKKLCLSCKFHQPLDANDCPKCDRASGDIELDIPSVNFDDMRLIFDESEMEESV